MTRKRMLFITNGVQFRNGWSVVGIELTKRLARTHLLRQLETGRNTPSVLLNFLLLPKDLVRFTANSPKRPDVIICNLEPVLPLAVLLKWLTGASQLVLIVHGTYARLFYGNSFGAHFMRWCAGKVDRVVVPSAYTKRILEQGIVLPTSIVPWGVDVARFHPAPKRSLAPIVLFASPPKKRKGWTTALRAFAETRAAVKDVRMMVGTTSSPQALRDVQRAGLQEVIQFTGRVSDKERVRLFQQATVHLLPCVNVSGHFDGFGLVHLEANACGVPTIGSKGCGNESAIEEGVSGYLCRQKDYRKIARILKRLLTDKQLQSRFRKTTRMYALEHSWDNCVKKLREFLF